MYRNVWSNMDRTLFPQKRKASSSSFCISSGIPSHGNLLQKKTERPVDLISLIPFKYRAMEFAALLSFILVDYVDGILISALLLVNASIGMFSPIACVSSAECLQG